MALCLPGVAAIERTKLEQIVRATTAPVRLVERARIILLSLDGLAVPKIAARIGVSEETARH